MNNLTIYQHEWDSNSGDVSIGNGFINSHTNSQCNGSSTFKDMYGDIESGDVSSGYDSINCHTAYQQNGLKSLMDYNIKDDVNMNDNLQSGDLSSGIVLINSHIL